jgi:hypothetical protein
MSVVFSGFLHKIAEILLKVACTFIKEFAPQQNNDKIVVLAMSRCYLN